MTRRRRVVQHKLFVINIPNYITNDLIDIIFRENLRTNYIGCWLRGDDSTQYPAIKYNGKLRPLSRILLSLKLGRVILDHACHTCDIPCCINPDHLFEGTHSQNMKDMRDKGRAYNFRIKPKKYIKTEYYKSKADNSGLEEANNNLADLKSRLSKC